MKLLVASLTVALSCGVLQAQENTLTPAERKAGWTLLFDGKSTDAFRQAYGTAFPAHGWSVQNGELQGKFTSGMESGDGADIVTKETYASFEMYFDWKLGPGGNSGVKYFIEERLPAPEKGSQAGYEYQIIDDANYIYNGVHLAPRLKTAAIYDVVAAKKPDVKMDQWHRSRIRVQGNHITHWLDGKRVLDIDRTSAEFKTGVETGKFHNYAGFASIPRGHILLQDHGHNVSFRNLKILRLP